jgi:hypothetical protein
MFEMSSEQRRFGTATHEQLHVLVYRFLADVILRKQMS